MSNLIENRYEFVLLFDVENGNPNGDPDAGNMPRVDPETNFGIVTDVCLKRKVRNYVEIVKGRAKPFDIYVQEKAILTQKQGEAYSAEATAASGSSDRIARAREWMCRNFYDVRMFGAVMSLKENNCGQVRGPVQFNFARSIDPIVPLDVTITRVAVATERESQSQDGDNRTMGRKSIVPYGLYRAEGFVSAHLAQQTGCSEEDLALLWEALSNMFDHDRSAARGKMVSRALIAFKHESRLGNAPAHLLLSRVNVERLNRERPARSFYDYRISLDENDVPKGVEIQKLLWP